MSKKAITGLVAGIVIAAGAVFGLGVSFSDAVKIAFDKDAAKAYCAKLIDANEAD